MLFAGSGKRHAKGTPAFRSRSNQLELIEHTFAVLRHPNDHANLPTKKLLRLPTRAAYDCFSLIRAPLVTSGKAIVVFFSHIQ